MASNGDPVILSVSRAAPSTQIPVAATVKTSGGYIPPASGKAPVASLAQAARPITRTPGNTSTSDTYTVAKFAAIPAAIPAAVPAVTTATNPVPVAYGVKSSQQSTSGSQPDLAALTAQLNKHLNDSGRPDQYRVDPQSGAMIQEINPSTGAVIGQFAASEFPALARSVGASGLLIDNLA